MSTETTSSTWAVCFIPSERALAFTARDKFSPGSQHEASFTLPSIAVTGTSTYDDGLCS